jgi:hypothetical protein
MRFAFLLKKQTGFHIEDASLKALSAEIAKEKVASAESEAEKPAEQEPQVEEKPKKKRKPRAKKAEAESQALAQVAEQKGLIAFL